MKPKKSRPQLPLPYLIPADFRLPESLLNQAMLRVAILLNRGICKEFYWVCNHINVEGKVDVSFDAAQLAIRKHEEVGRVRLRKRKKKEPIYDPETGEHVANHDFDVFSVVPDDSLFKWWEEQETGAPNASTASSNKPSPPRLTVDLACKTVTLDGTKYDVSSDNAIRWVKVLADHPGEWISGSELTKYDSDLIVRTDRLKRFLPTQVRALIEQRTGAGSRIRL